MTNNTDSDSDDEVSDILLEEVDAMVRYASGSGLEVPPNVVALLQYIQQKIRQQSHLSREDMNWTAAEARLLAAHHAVMSNLVWPSKPQSIVFIHRNRQGQGFLNLLGPVPVVQFLLVVTLFFLFSIVFLALSPDVNSVSMTHGVFESSGLVLFVNLSFLLACGGLGASFAGLHDLNQHIRNGTYDPRLDSIYLVELIMGLMSGFIISELLPLNGTGEESGAVLDKPVVALLGGFSSDVIYQILRRLVLQLHRIMGDDKKPSQPPAMPASMGVNREREPVERTR